MRHLPYGHEPSSSSPYGHELPYRSAPYDEELARSYHEEIRTLVKAQRELRDQVKDLVGRIEKMEEKLDENSEKTSFSHNKKKFKLHFIA